MKSRESNFLLWFRTQRHNWFISKGSTLNGYPLRDGLKEGIYQISPSNILLKRKLEKKYLILTTQIDYFQIHWILSSSLRGSCNILTMIKCQVSETVSVSPANFSNQLACSPPAAVAVRWQGKQEGRRRGTAWWQGTHDGGIDVQHPFLLCLAQ